MLASTLAYLREVSASHVQVICDSKKAQKLQVGPCVRQRQKHKLKTVNVSLLIVRVSKVLVHCPGSVQLCPVIAAFYGAFQGILKSSVNQFFSWSFSSFFLKGSLSQYFFLSNFCLFLREVT